MPLTETSKKFYFGTAEPQKLRDWGGPANQILYEGYAVAGALTSDPAWVIYKHFFDINGNDIGDQHLYGVVWDLRGLYTYG